MADPLQVSQVDVRLGEHQVLTGVSLRVGPDELVGLIGPNGAGKTTLLRSMLALVPLSGGRSRCSAERRRRLVPTSAMSRNGTSSPGTSRSTC